MSTLTMLAVSNADGAVVHGAVRRPAERGDRHRDPRVTVRKQGLQRLRERVVTVHGYLLVGYGCGRRRRGGDRNRLLRPARRAAYEGPHEGSREKGGARRESVPVHARMLGARPVRTVRPGSGSAEKIAPPGGRVGERGEQEHSRPRLLRRRRLRRPAAERGPRRLGRGPHGARPGPRRRSRTPGCWSPSSPSSARSRRTRTGCAARRPATWPSPPSRPATARPCPPSPPPRLARPAGTRTARPVAVPAAPGAPGRRAREGRHHRPRPRRARSPTSSPAPSLRAAGRGPHQRRARSPTRPSRRRYAPSSPPSPPCSAPTWARAAPTAPSRSSSTRRPPPAETARAGRRGARRRRNTEGPPGAGPRPGAPAGRDHAARRALLRTRVRTAAERSAVDRARVLLAGALARLVRHERGLAEGQLQRLQAVAQRRRVEGADLGRARGRPDRPGRDQLAGLVEVLVLVALLGPGRG